MRPKYEGGIYLFLSLYRFFSFALAIILMQVIPPPGTTPLTDFQLYLIIGLLGAYTALRVSSPFRWWQRPTLAMLLLGVDLLICIFLVLYTGGLHSGLLLYSLTPVITAALLFEYKIALLAAGLSSFSLAVAHLGLSQFSDRFVWIMQYNSLSLLIIYTIVCFIIAIMAYRTNLNIYRRIEEESIFEERRRIGREMHDGVAQALSYLNLKAKTVSDSLSSQHIDQALAGLGDIQEIVQDTYEDVRESIDQLSTEALSFPLIPTLATYTEEFSRRYGIPVQFDAPKNPLKLPPVVELQLLRIAQEALSNVRRHSQATQVWVKLVNAPAGVEIAVRDNGQGFSLDSEKDSLHHRGLGIMRERAESLGGTLTITTAPGEGTEIRVNLPGGKVRL